MPPANSRSQTPPAVDSGQRAQTPPSYLSALSEALESPVTQDVYNLAATLTTQAEQEHYDASLPSLRVDVNQHQSRLDRSRDRLLALQRERERERERNELDYRNRTDRLRRVMNRLGRLPDDSRSTAYGDRIPSQNSLYDWSPAHEADDEDELDQVLAELRREQPNTNPDLLRMLARSQVDSERERSRLTVSRLFSSAQPSTGDSSLRSAAILQSVRRQPRFSARTRDYASRHNADRDGANREWRDHYGTDSPRATPNRLSERRTSPDQLRDRDMLARVDQYRRNYLDRTSNSTSTATPMLEQTIKYLARIRYSNSIDNSLNYAIDAGFLGKEYFCEDQQDFVLDPLTIPVPAETSWLSPGAVLSGCQHATTVTSTVITTGSGISTTLYRFRNHDSMTSTFLDSPNRSSWLSHSYSSPRHRNAHAADSEIITAESPQQDRWPVKVTVHSVDWNRMVLSATMEAYNVPSHPHTPQSVLNSSIEGQPSVRTSSITTYLEGEILDFNTHTLLTESFKSTAANDATYWSKLPPFQAMTHEEIIRSLTSRTWFNEVLSREWILMRWKERCFVKSLNRSTADPVQLSSSTSSSSVHAHAVTSLFNSFHSSSTRENHPEPTSTTHLYTGDNGDVEHSFDDSGCGLTISGFYYVCLRRSDGHLEGLYYDPQSSPYQCLKLDSVRGGVFPAWSFR